MKVLFEAARPPDCFAQRKTELSAVDLIAHEMLVHPELSGAVDTKMIRSMLRYKAGIKELNQPIRVIQPLRKLDSRIFAIGGL